MKNTINPLEFMYNKHVTCIVVDSDKAEECNKILNEKNIENVVLSPDKAYICSHASDGVAMRKIMERVSPEERIRRESVICAMANDEISSMQESGDYSDFQYSIESIEDRVKSDQTNIDIIKDQYYSDSIL